MVAGNPHLDEVIVAPRPRGLARIADDLRLARRLAASALRPGHRPARRAAQRLADFGDRRAEPNRLRYQGTDAGCTRARSRAPAHRRSRHSVVNQWDLLEAIEGWPVQGPDRARDRVEMAADSRADARVAERLQQAGVTPQHELIVVHVSAGNPFRRWPEPAFTTLVAGLAASSPARRIVLSSGPSDRDAADRIAAAARKRLGPAADRIVDFGEFDLARASGPDRTQPVVRRRRHRPAAHRRDHGDPDRRNIWTDECRALGAVARSATPDGIPRGCGAALPAVRSACLRAWRFSMSDYVEAGRRPCGSGARDGSRRV